MDTPIQAAWVQLQTPRVFPILLMFQPSPHTFLIFLQFDSRRSIPISQVYSAHSSCHYAIISSYKGGEIGDKFSFRGFYW